MKPRILILYALVCSVLFLIPGVLAHVPYLEHRDFSVQHPFQVRRSIIQSLGVYAWLETDHIHPSTDIDVYTFTIQQPTLVHIEVIVPVVNG